MRNLGNIENHILYGEPTGRIIAIGDIHGCLHTLKALVGKLNIDAKNDTIVFLGDYIDRGLHSCETVKYVREFQRSLPNVVCLRGNHEEFMVENNCSYSRLWDRNGGCMTIGSYENNGVDPHSDVLWMDQLPLVYVTQENIFCHAGLAWPDLLQNDPEEVLWDRDWISYNSDIEREKPVVFGHTPDLSGTRVIQNGDLCLDGGCVFGGKLCAAIIHGDDIAIIEEEIHEEDRGPWAN